MPYLAVLPNAYSSILIFSGRNATMTWSPPAISTEFEVLMSVPLPARFVAIIAYPELITVFSML